MLKQLLNGDWIDLSEVRLISWLPRKTFANSEMYIPDRVVIELRQNENGNDPRLISVEMPDAPGAIWYRDYLAEECNNATTK